MNQTRGDFVLTDERIDPGPVQDLLNAHSYWAPNRPRDIVERSIANSLCHAVWHGDKLVAFARLITDQATFACLADVIVHPDYRGSGIGKWIVASLVEHPAVETCKLMLRTRDAHGLYEQYGFERSECMTKAPRDGSRGSITAFSVGSACAEAPGTARI